MSDIRDVLIRNHIARLWGVLGPQPLPVDEAMLRKQFEEKDYTGMFKAIKEQMVLLLQLRIGFVNKGGPEGVPAWIQGKLSYPIYGTPEYKRTKETIFIRKSFLAQAQFPSVVYAMAHELSHVLLGSLQHQLRNDEVAADLTVLLCGYGSFYKEGRVYSFPAEEGESGEESFLSDLLEPFNELTRSFGGTTSASPAYTTRTLGYLTENEIRFAEKIIAFRRR